MANHEFIPVPEQVKDISGQRFGRLVVVGFSHTKRWRAYWYCRCACGTVKSIRGDSLRSGRIVSCGCYNREIRIPASVAASTTHGMSGTPEHNAWKAMKGRCDNPNNREYPYYGGRGIQVCARWRESFETFYADMGPRPSRKHSLDRIDNDGDYSPDNCRWATRIMQANNKSSNRILEFNGKRQTIAEWSRETGISEKNITGRLNRRGWSIERTLTTPNRR